MSAHHQQQPPRKSSRLHPVADIVHAFGNIRDSVAELRAGPTQALPPPIPRSHTSSEVEGLSDSLQRYNLRDDESPRGGFLWNEVAFRPVYASRSVSNQVEYGPAQLYRTDNVREHEMNRFLAQTQINGLLREVPQEDESDRENDGNDQGGNSSPLFRGQGSRPNRQANRRSTASGVEQAAKSDVYSGWNASNIDRMSQAQSNKPRIQVPIQIGLFNRGQSIDSPMEQGGAKQNRRHGRRDQY